LKQVTRKKCCLKAEAKKLLHFPVFILYVSKRFFGNAKRNRRGRK
jgi:hypothetical protein